VVAGHCFFTLFQNGKEKTGRVVMRSETETRELKEKIDKLTGFITDFGSQGEYKKAAMTYACNASDTLSWLLGEISTEDFEGEVYLGVANMQQIAEGIEERKGKKLQDYK
jgi:hypothetical protein